ncbi:hypothetical protein HWB76_gp060 [Streptomyces phage Blueeyedbeauty]|uniref:Uncharacterized protein n=1 Tax=Streptomyces phage Blueeyedbeauty TaxID=2250336 RepID=A0A345L238_9CAUD|nr:hypothetical protein HWB76_gp060 [Streptomyces phage Blueeyedbeauty]AXH49340.1 hypothetical protein SEA_BLUEEYEDBEAUTY_233 [Streptomyces phage Blueeyedbeauty]
MRESTMYFIAAVVALFAVIANAASNVGGFWGGLVIAMIVGAAMGHFFAKGLILRGRNR